MIVYVESNFVLELALLQETHQNCEKLNTSDDAIPKCFLNRNSKDFSQLNIKETLERHNCKLLFNFEKGYNYIQSQVNL